MTTNERRAAVLEKVAASVMPAADKKMFPGAIEAARRDGVRIQRRKAMLADKKTRSPRIKAQHKRFVEHLAKAAPPIAEEPFKAALGKKMRGGLMDLIGRALAVAGTAAATGVGLGATALYNKLKKPPTAFQALKGAFGPGSAGRKALAIGGIAAALGAGITGAEGATDSISKAYGKRKGFSTMMEGNPWLKKEPAKDVKRFYNTLHNFAPKVAKDPLAAGSFMRRSMAFKDEGIQAADIKTLADINKAGKKTTDGILQNAFRGMTSGAAFGS